MKIDTCHDAQALVESSLGDIAISRPIEPELLNFKALKVLIGLSRTTIWRLEARGEFPARVQAGGRCVAWRRHDVYQWIYARPAASSFVKKTGARRA
jgi:prophage regulatory protein